jgi:hypothetical protein
MKYLLASIVILGMPALASLSLGQTSAIQAPIMCGEKDKIEDAACLSKLNGIFTRDGDKLTLKLDGGKSKTYVSNQAACDGENVDAEKCLVFSVMGYIPQTRWFLISAGLYECGDVLLVSRRSGSETVISHEIPVLSPSAKYLVSTDQSDACERKYNIAIWSMDTDPPKLEFKYVAKEYENWEVRAWKDDSHISMKAWVNEWVNGKMSYDQEAELVRKDKGWALVLGKKVDRKQ